MEVLITASIMKDDAARKVSAMANELGEVNERMNEGWSIEEVFGLLPQISLSGDWQFATINEYQEVFNYFESIEG